MTTEQESKLPAALDADAEEDVAAAGLAACALDDEAGADGGDDEGELQAASKISAPHAMTEIATRRRRI